MKNKNHPAVSYSFFAFFVLLAFIHLPHPLLFAYYGLAAVAFYPAMFAKFSFDKRWKKGHVFALAGLAAFLFSIPLIHHYQGVDDQSAAETRKAKYKIAEYMRLKKDSFARYFNLARESGNKKPDSALFYVAYGATYSSDSNDFQITRSLKEKIFNRKVDLMMSKNQMKSAALLLDSLIATDPANANYFYKRALCLQKAGSLRAAITDLKRSKELGNTQAESLFDKLNPVRKYVVGYVTLCCDGTISYARGRGACSHHGGVCNWNSPIYETGRKYE